MDFTSLSEIATLDEIGRRLQRERLNRNIEQAELARRAGVSRRALQNLEAGRSCTLNLFIRVLKALDKVDALDAFLPAAGPSPIQLAKLAGRERRRASTGRLTRRAKDR
jgi:putative transcriptional regulator